MTSAHQPDPLADLRATVAALQAELGRSRRRRTRWRRALPGAFAILLVALVPFATLAATPFTDLTGGIHDGDIEAIYDAGITKGCEPGVAYCPEGLVTRQEMASFLARAAGLGGNPPVANARTAQSVPDRSITATKLSAAGAAPGQALIATADGAAWQTVTGPTGPQGEKGEPGTPAPRPAAGIVLPDGSSPLPATRYTVYHNPDSRDYYITFPAGTFTAPPPNGAVAVCLFVPAGPAFITGINTVNIGASGSAVAAVSFSAETYFQFICAQVDRP